MLKSYYDNKKFTPKQKAAELVYDAMDKLLDCIPEHMMECATEKEWEQVGEQVTKYANRIMKMVKRPEVF